MAGKNEVTTGTIVAKHYRLMRKLGTGAFGEIYMVVNVDK